MNWDRKHSATGNTLRLKVHSVSGTIFNSLWTTRNPLQNLFPPKVSARKQVRRTFTMVIEWKLMYLGNGNNPRMDIWSRRLVESIFSTNCGSGGGVATTPWICFVIDCFGHGDLVRWTCDEWIRSKAKRRSIMSLYNRI